METASALEPYNTSASVKYEADPDIVIIEEPSETPSITDIWAEIAGKNPRNYWYATFSVDTSNDNVVSIKGDPIPTKEQAVIDNIEQKLFYKIYFPKDWKIEGINTPNMAAKEKALAVCKELFEKYDLVPDKIASTKEEGVFLRYDYVNYTKNISLIIEVYNTLETAALVCDNQLKKNCYSEDIQRLDFTNAIQNFKAKIT